MHKLVRLPPKDHCGRSHNTEQHAAERYEIAVIGRSEDVAVVVVLVVVE